MSKEKKHEKKSNDKEKIADLTDSLQRLQADFENYKKQVEKDNIQFIKRAKANIISKILPILDSFELALKNTSNKEEFKKGVELIYSQFFQTLEDMGLRLIDSKGKCDPYKHEVLLTQESDKDDNIILEELQKGYMLHDMVLRHSKVKVAKHTEPKSSDAKKDEDSLEKKGDDKSG